MSEYNLGKDFLNIYKSAKVGSKELILSKGMMILPVFNPNNKSIKDKIVLSEEQLLKSGYSSFVFEGYLMNSDLDFTFFKYIMCIAQRSNSRIVNIDVLAMFRDLGFNPSNYKFYKEKFNEHLNKGNDSKFNYTESSTGSITKDGFYTRTTEVSKGIYFVVEISTTVASSIVAGYNHKLSYENKPNIKSGVASLLLEKIKILAFCSEYELRLELFFHLLNLQGKRESKVKVLNRAIDNLIDVGFIISCIDDKRGGKSIYSKKLKINKKYSLEKKSHVIIKEESPEFLELEKKLQGIEAKDDNLDDVFHTNHITPKPIILAKYDISSENNGTDISGFDFEVDIDSWVDQSHEEHFTGKIYFDDERDFEQNFDIE